ncbi:MAG: adenylate/guanylate cyclase domain-containing protein [Actinobacteria bacterium]|nr:adenylate/guanylate cyclase domain-containing protein [Actinomycetota bacterium]
MADTPQTRYASSGGISIAYQVFGEGALDLVVALPWVSNLDLQWESPMLAHFFHRLAAFARVIVFDRRGVGLSDPVDGVATLEERMDDIRAVMDAAGSERAALLGMSEGAMACILFAATYPERTSALLLWGAMARSTEDDEYPWAASKEALIEAGVELIGPMWGQGATIDIFSPSLAEDEQARQYTARIERGAGSPLRAWQILKMFLETDVREALPLIQAPTLVMHRRHDYAVNVRASRWLATQIHGSHYVEFEGIDHFPWVGDAEAPLATIEEFLTGVRPAIRPERVLATVVFTDIVGSTERATEVGDHRWRELLDRQQALVRERIALQEGREIKTTGDGFLVTFDGPSRAVRFARSVVLDAPTIGIEIRAGAHAGEVELIGDDIGGIAVHVASRICGLAGGGQVLTSRTVHDLTVGSGLCFEAWGRRELKGVDGEWELYEVG